MLTQSIASLALYKMSSGNKQSGSSGHKNLCTSFSKSSMNVNDESTIENCSSDREKDEIMVI